MMFGVVPMIPPQMMYPPVLPFWAMKQKNIKIKFTPEEDEKLKNLVQTHGTNCWTLIAGLMGNRNARQCRERWKNYVNPELRNEPWTLEEDKLLVEKYEEYGPRWNKIAKHFANRSDNSLRNRWQLMLRQWERQKQVSVSNYGIEGRFIAEKEIQQAVTEKASEASRVDVE